MAIDKYTSISNTIEGGAQPETMEKRANALARMATGNAPLPRLLSVAVDHDFVERAREAHLRSDSKQYTPDYVLANPRVAQQTQDILTSFTRGPVNITELMHQAYQAGKRGDMSQLLSLKTAGALLLEKFGADGNREIWKKMSEDNRRIVRLAEIMVMGAQMNYISLKRGSNGLPVPVAEFWETQFSKYAKNDDLPEFFKRNLTASSERLQTYHEQQESVLEEQPQAEQETQKASTAETIVPAAPETAPASLSPEHVLHNGSAATTIAPNGLHSVLHTEKTEMQPDAAVSDQVQAEIDDLFSGSGEMFERRKEALLAAVHHEQLPISPEAEQQRQRYLAAFDNEINFYNHQRGNWIDRFVGERTERYFARINVATNLGRFLPIFGRKSWRQVIEARHNAVASMRIAAERLEDQEPYTAALLTAIAHRFDSLNAREGLRYTQSSWRRWFGLPIARPKPTAPRP